MDRRTLLKGAAWAVPVLAVSVATPIAAASMTPSIPVSCVLLNSTGSPFYRVTYNDGTSETLHRSEVAKNKELKTLCKVPANGNEGL